MKGNLQIDLLAEALRATVYSAGKFIVLSSIYTLL